MGVNIAYRLGLAVAGAGGLFHSGVLQSVVLPNLLPGRWAEFAFGMVAAEAYARGALERIPLGWVYAWIPAMAAGVLLQRLPVSHLAFGGAFTLLLIAVLAEKSLTARVFSWPPLVALGVMSYSLYLVHQPVVQALAYVLRHNAGLGDTAAFGALILLLPVTVAIAWLLFVLVESRTLTSRPLEVSGWFAAVLFPRLPWAAVTAKVAVDSPAA